MKIVYIHQYFHTPAMSGGTRSYEMARRLVEWGHEVHLVTTNCSTEIQQEAWKVTKEDGIHVHWTQVPYNNRFSYADRISAFVKFAWRCSARAMSLKSDVVFATSTPLTVALPGILAAWRMRVPFVFEVRDLWPELPIAMGALKNPLATAAASRLELAAYRNAREIVALSPGMKAGVVKRGIDPERVTVIPNSCDLSLFDIPEQAGREFRRRHEWLGDRPLVIYTGTLGKINGVDYLVRLAAKVLPLNPEIRFAIVGDGSEIDFVRREAEAAQVLNRNLFLLGRVSKQDIPVVLSAANLATSLFIDLPEMWANSANKFFDALAAGRPVAINHEGWLAELIRSYELGVVMPPQDLEAAARSVVDFLSQPIQQEAARKAGRRLARAQFDRDALARQLEAVLARACGQSITLIDGQRSAA